MKNLIAVGIGGFIGSISRYGISMLMLSAGERTKLPLATILVNIAGSFIAGVLLALFRAKDYSPVWYYFSMVGFCGGFTTFSMFSVETLRLLKDGDATIALLYTLLSITVCVAAVWMGMTITERLLK